MAKGITQTVTVRENNQKSSQVSKTVELIVIDNRLVPDTRDLDHGVNTVNIK